MVGKAQKIRLGIFITILTALMIAAFVFIAGDKLMEEWDYYYIHYSDTSVNGLQVGGQVRYHGIEIGKVDEILISQEDVSRVEVRISVTKGTPIKSDVEAHLVLVGITGLKVVELSGGTNYAPTIEPESEIPAGTSVLDNITGKAEIMAEKLEMIMNNILAITNEENQQKVNSILTHVDSFIIENREPVNSTVSNLDSITVELNTLLKTTNEIMIRVNEIVQSSEIDTMLTNFAAVSENLSKVDIEKLVENLNATVAQAKQTIQRIDLTVVRSQEDIVSAMETLRETIEYLQEFARLISEEPSILYRGSE